MRSDLADSCVKLRSDLEIRPETPESQSHVILKDPLTLRFYRFTWVQAAVLRGLDGRHDAGAVAEAASAQCLVKVERSQVEDFTAKLRGLLLLDDAPTWARLESLAKRRHRILDSLLSVKIHAVNPDRWLARIDRRMGRFFFGPAFLTLAWVSIAAGAILSILNWEQLYLSLPRLFTLYSIPLILIVAFAVITTHELAHGLTLKHFGGKVEELGFLFLYFFPAFYCNVSDAWLLKKRERMLVSAAGGFVQLVVWSWATIMWRLLSPETLGSRICLIAVAFSGVQTVLNFIPLIRLDGYYLLSDFLETPNLRQKAFGHLKRMFNAWLTGTGVPAASGTRREQRIFMVYGLSSFVFSAGLLLFVLARLGSWMITEYRTWGILMFSVICVSVVPAASKENVAATGKLLASLGARVRKSPYLSTMLAAALVACFLPWELKVTGDFTILPNSAVSVNLQVPGTLTKILVDEGTPVKSGDVLAEIQNLELSNAYEDTRGELASSRASLSLLKAGSRPEEIERARRVLETKRTDLESAGRVEQERRMLRDTVAKREAELENARNNYERSRTLFDQGLIPKNEMDRDQTAFAVAQKALAEAEGVLKVLEERTDGTRQVKMRELAQAQSELNILLAGSRKESIEAMAAEVARLEEKLNILGQQLEQLKIRSPINGVVTTPYLRNKIGEYIDKGSSFCEVVDARLVLVDMPVPEKEIGDVAIGYPIVLKVNAYPKRSFTALVKAISPVATPGEQDRKVVVRAELGNDQGQLRAGMTGVGKIQCGKRMIGELVTRRLVRWLRTEFWEYLP